MCLVIFMPFVSILNMPTEFRLFLSCLFLSSLTKISGAARGIAHVSPIFVVSNTVTLVLWGTLEGLYAKSCMVIVPLV
jgi:hypothetical protein